MKTSNAPSSATYHPLNQHKSEIRLLKLTAAPNPSWPLQFDLLTIDLDAIWKKPYYTISYTWGASPGKANIVLNGRDTLVPDSAEIALRAVMLRQSTAASDAPLGLPIWIDAVCIDQQNLEEKTRQVAMMGRIYSQAKGVFVWLGTEGARFTEGFVRTCELLRQERLKSSGRGRLRRSRAVHFQPARAIPDDQQVDLPFPEGADEKSFWSFLGSRWFERLWVVQEVVLSRQIMLFCGTHCIPWELFVSGVTCAVESRGRDVDDGRLMNVYSMLRMKAQRQPRTMVDLSLLTLRREANEPLDRVFALLGMLGRSSATASQVGTIVPDYTKDILQVFTDAMFQVMETSDCLEGLEMTQTLVPLPDQYLETWPSWVPRWHEIQTGVQNFFPMGCEAFKADNDTTPDITLDYTSPWPLQISGVIFDAVASIICRLAMPVDQDWTSSETRKDLLVPLWNAAVDWSRKSLEDIAKCLVSCELEYGDTEDGATCVQDFAACLLALRADRHLPPNPTFEHILTSAGAQYGDADAFLQRVSSFDHYMLFQLRNHSLGLAHDGIRVGDMACILFGADEPFIMRKVDEAWKLRGIAFIPDINKGEYVQRLEKEDRLNAETIKFCIS